MLTAEIAGGVSSPMHTLEAFVERSAGLVRERAAGGAKPSDALLYTGLQQVAVPAALLDDPLLSLPAKMLWIQMQRHAAHGGGAAFPTYREAARMLGTSEPTVANAITQLRILRWISVCQRVRHRGRFAGNIYAIHGEPISVSDAALLDPEYLDFCEASVHHDAKRTRLIAEAAMGTLDRMIDSGDDPMGLMDGLGVGAAFTRRYDRRSQSVDDESVDTFETELNASHRLKNFGAADSHRLKNFKSVTSKEKSNTYHRLKNFGSPSSSSSGFLKKKKEKETTTTTTSPDSPHAHAREDAPDAKALEWPDGITANERNLVARHLQRAPDDPALRQQILDEWWGHLCASRAGLRTPIARPFGFLHALVRAACEERFDMSDAGITVEIERHMKTGRVQPPEIRQYNPDWAAHLAWPKRLDERTRCDAILALKEVPEELRQDLLDDWQAAMGDASDCPHKAAIGLLGALCRQAKRGDYVLGNGGRVVRELRQRQAINKSD